MISDKQHMNQKLESEPQGVAWVHLVGSLAIFAFGMPLMTILEWSVADWPWITVILYILGYTLLSSFPKMHFLHMVELFPVEVRNAGVGLSYNETWLWFQRFFVLCVSLANLMLISSSP